MAYEFNFGTLGSAASRPKKGNEVFRLAILGDFSARANRGEVEVGDALAGRKPLVVEADNLDEIIQRMEINLKLDIGGDDGVIEVGVGSIDDFHPDELYDRLEIFSKLSGLRRQLSNSATFAKAAKEVQSWLGVSVPKKPRRRKAKSRGAVLAANFKLSDFARLIDREPVERPDSAVDQLLKQIVGPHVVPAKDPRQDLLLNAVDAAISDAMRRVLHHPDFQSTEALWRSIDLVVRRMETGGSLQVVLYDITAEEVAADLSSCESLEETGLYKLLVEKPVADARQGPLAAIVANFLFERTPPHAELLGRLAKVGAAANAPVVSNISTFCLEKRKAGESEHPLVTESWKALKSLPEAGYLALVLPRFLLRHPYGKKSDPISRFNFEEFTPQSGIQGMLWGYAAIVTGIVLGQTFTKQGLKKMNVGSILSIGDMPYYFFTDRDGDQIALPCTERLLNVRAAADVASRGFIPLLSILNRAEVKLGSIQSLAGRPIKGAWPDNVPQQLPPAAKPVEEPASSDDDSSSGDSSSESSDSSDSSSDSGGLGDVDLDALLADLGSSDDSSSETSSSDESSSDQSSSESSDDMDPDLAKLLAELG